MTLRRHRPANQRIAATLDILSTARLAYAKVSISPENNSSAVASSTKPKIGIDGSNSGRTNSVKRATPAEPFMTTVVTEREQASEYVASPLANRFTRRLKEPHQMKGPMSCRKSVVPTNLP
jgi:hypothetical protein